MESKRKKICLKLNLNEKMLFFIIKIKLYVQNPKTFFLNNK